MIDNTLHFISIDWGTSSFRLRLVQLNNSTVLKQVTNDQGVSIVMEQWKNSTAGLSRLDYFRKFVTTQINALKEPLSTEIPVVISGMASSSIGMSEIEYKSLPFDVQNDQLSFESMKPDANLAHPVYLLGGLRSNQNVMRGEETMLAGLTKQEVSFSKYIVLPGTHSKHVVMEESRINTINTFMTGEVFELLAEKSVLKSSVVQSDLDTESFLEGVDAAANSSLLSTIFLTRTNQLFHRFSTQQNYHWLSGLLIGHELEQFKTRESVCLIVGSKLAFPYQLALERIHPGIKIQSIHEVNALVNGQKSFLRKKLNK